MQELSSLFLTHRLSVMHALVKFREYIPYGLGWLVGCFGFNSPLREYFSLYRAVSQREGDRGEKG